MAYLEADAEKIPLDALGTTANAVNWTIEAIVIYGKGGGRLNRMGGEVTTNGGDAASPRVRGFADFYQRFFR
jgi:hypothetical protein